MINKTSNIIVSDNLLIKNNDTKDEKNIDMSKAIKDYTDEYLTGLTDDELEIIEKRVAEYLEENPVNTQLDREALNLYIKSLLVEFGYKGDVNEFAESFNINEENSENINEQRSFEQILQVKDIFLKNMTESYGFKSNLNIVQN